MPRDTKPADLWDVEQAAEYLGYSRETLYKKVQREQVPYVKIGGMLRFDAAELDQWIEDGCPPNEVSA